ncbi:MAG: hypothetical protein C0432_01660 [Candidatus Puniceispirillum sp.]|nr:hypothetical protein [Candidatus Pelagibacter sp.]MBA4282983.1 hypothetical protein [Candidatus Puniceispirillum sp.]
MVFDKFSNISKHWLFKVFIVLIALSFSSFGIIEVINRFLNDKPIAKVGSISINAEDVARRIQSESARIQRMSQGKIDPAFLRQLGLEQIALDKLIAEKALILFQKDLKLGLSIHNIQKYIRSMKEFHTDGDFDPDKYYDLLRQNNIKEDSFVKDLKKDLYTHQILAPLMDNAQLPRVYEKLMVNALSEKISVKIVKVDLEQIKKVKDVKDEDLKSYFEKHKNSYRQPEMRSAQYVIFNVKNMTEHFKITDEELRAKYEEMLPQFTVPENRIVKRASFRTKPEAEQAYSMLQKGLKFSELAKKMSSATIDSLGSIERGQLSDDATKAIYSTAENKVSEVIKNGNKFDLYYVEKINKETRSPYKDVKDNLEDKINKEKYLEFFNGLRNEFEDYLAAGNPLAEAAKKYGFKVYNLDLIDRSGQTKEGKNLFKDLPEDIKNAVLDEMFKQKDGSETAIIDLDENTSYAVKLGTVTPSVIPAFDVIKDKLVKDYTTAEARTNLMKEIQTAKKDGSLSKDFSKFVSDHHLGKIEKVVFSHFDLEMNKSSDNKSLKILVDMPQKLVRKIFSTSVGDVEMSDFNEDPLTLIFVEKREAYSLSEKEQKQITDSLYNLVKDDVPSHVLGYAKERVKIKMDQEALKSLAFALHQGD